VLDAPKARGTLAVAHAVRSGARAKPRSARPVSKKLFASTAAAAINTSDTATCPTTSAPPSQCPRLQGLAASGSALTSAATSVRAAITLGARPNSTVVKTVTARVNSTTRTSVANTSGD
jgi:hypothetical protein